MSRSIRVCAHGSTEAKCYVCRTFALEARVEALETLLREYRDCHDDWTHEDTGGNDHGCACPLCDRACVLLDGAEPVESDV